MSTESLHFDVVIIGGGIVGLACAYEISSKKSNTSVLLVEKNERLGAETSSRSSEVIHAGIYYKEFKNKEFHCIEGRELLYKFCIDHEVSYKNTGKLIIGQTESDLRELEEIHLNASRNNISCEFIESTRISSLECNISAKYALLSRTTGIIDSESLVQKLEYLSEQNGVTIIRESEVLSIEQSGSQYRLKLNQKGDLVSCDAGVVINCAGLYSWKISNEILGCKTPVRLKFVRGHYFTLPPKFQNHTSRLIYPIPDKAGGGLGIHLTLDMEGNCRLGPDTDHRYNDRPEVEFFEADIEILKAKFYSACITYLPQIKLDSINPAYVGVRPKPYDEKSGKQADFYIVEETNSGFKGFINLIGIESPGITAALSIAKKVLKMF